MIESLLLIREIIEETLNSMSINDPRYKNLIIAKNECNAIIIDEKINYYDSVYDY